MARESEDAAHAEFLAFGLNLGHVFRHLRDEVAFALDRDRDFFGGDFAIDTIAGEVGLRKEGKVNALVLEVAQLLDEVLGVGGGVVEYDV